MMNTKMEKYLKKHPYYLACIGIVFGMGIGMLLTYPLAGTHPVRWGVAFVAAAAVMKISTMWM